MHRLPILGLALVGALALSGCDKVAEKAGEKLAERAIEGQAKDGTKARVDLSGGSAKVTTTDASGKTSSMELGGAQVSEADVGIAFYGGAKPREGGSSKMVSPQGTTFSVMLHSVDGPDKVLAFYREKLKAQAQGKQFMDMNTGEGQATLVVADQQGKNSLQIHVARAADAGSDISIVAMRSAEK